MEKKNSEFFDLPCRYFNRPGPKNTESVMKKVAERITTSPEINNILVATCSGRTAMEAFNILGDSVHIIAVTHVTGFRRPNFQELPKEMKVALEEKGIDVLTCQHAFGGVGRGIRNKLGTYQVDEIIAYTLRMFGQGTKVAIEIALMAADAGLVRTDEDIIAIGGTGKGADTALLLRPTNSFNIFDLKIKEILCKPLL